MDALADMLINSKFDQHEIDKEGRFWKNIICIRIPDVPSWLGFERLWYGDQPMGWDQVGTKGINRGVMHDDFVRYKMRFIRRIILRCVAGNISV